VLSGNRHTKYPKGFREVGQGVKRYLWWGEASRNGCREAQYLEGSRFITLLNCYRYSQLSRVQLRKVKAGGSRELPIVRFYLCVHCLALSKAQGIELPRYKAAPLQVLGFAITRIRPYAHTPLASRRQPDYFHFTHDLRISRIR